MHPYLTALLAEERIADLRRQTESSRLAHRQIPPARRSRPQRAPTTSLARRLRRRLRPAAGL